MNLYQLLRVNIDSLNQSYYIINIWWMIIENYIIIVK